ncbi:MAG: phosphate ABC transporter permease PstA [Alphaproteobacteria bacterium]|nr:phosphate ABC transporter permease PstA [Alphaproteobacteria bacterium]
METKISPRYTDMITRSLKRRHRKETCLRFFGLTSILFGLAFLVILLGNIANNGLSALLQTYVELEVTVPDSALLDAEGKVSEEVAFDTNWDGLVKKGLRAKFPDASGMRERRALDQLVSANAGFDFKTRILHNPELLNQPLTVWFKTSDEVDQYVKGNMNVSVDESQRRLSDQQLAWIDELAASGLLERRFNTSFFTQADSREPESAGILGAAMGSAMAILVMLVLTLPLAVMSAIYLEYFAKPGRVTDFIEVNINNLAAVPSIVFGLLGLAVFLNFFQMPRSAPLVGGMVLSLMTLPTIIIASRAAIRAVPSSIRDAALGLGASNMQAALDHVLPMAMPGVLTGTIIGVAQALGESAPLLMIGMVAFIVDVPTTVTDPATVMPVQIFIWSNSAERAFYEKASLAILFLVLFLIVMNLTAVLLRRHFERHH